MVSKLTKRLVETLHPSERDVLVWDGGSSDSVSGFGLKLTPKGRRIFVFQYWSPEMHLTRRRVTIGLYGHLTVDQARTEAKKLAGRVAQGEDPAAEATRRRQRSKTATVSLLSTEYIAEIRPKKRPRTIESYESQFRLHIVPTLGRKPVSDVTHSDVTRLHSSLASTPVSANRVVALLSAFMRWCERRGYRLRDTNPCFGLELFPEQSRERFLTGEEIARLGDALRRAETDGLPPAPALARKPKNEAKRKHVPKTLGPIRANPFATAAIRFLLLTGWREQEALTLKWHDIDFDRGFASLMSTKTGKSHRPLGSPALLILQALPRVKGNQFVFPGSKPFQPLKEIRRTWYAARHAAQLGDVRLHDLRHTVASFSVGAGHSLFLTGALLGHSNPSTTKKYAHLADDARRAAADAVSSEIAARMEMGSSAVPLRGQAKPTRQTRNSVT